MSYVNSNLKLVATNETDLPQLHVQLPDC